jgi:hypothetical protein
MTSPNCVIRKRTRRDFISIAGKSLGLAALSSPTVLASNKHLRPPRRPPLQLFPGDHETFNRLAFDEAVHNLGDVRDLDVPVKKVIGFD